MAKKKVTYEVILRKHAIIEDDGTENKVAKEVQRMADYLYYQNSDSVQTTIVSCDDLD
jgi:hypothetical protein